jgi:hypothetical protein
MPGTSRLTVLLARAGISTFNGRTGRGVAGSGTSFLLIGACAGTGFVITTDAIFSGWGTLDWREKCLPDVRLMASQPRCSGIGGVFVYSLLGVGGVGGDPTGLRVMVICCGFTMYCAAIGLSKLGEPLPAGFAGLGPSRGMRGVGGDAKTVTLSGVAVRVSTCRRMSCSKGSANGSLSLVCVDAWLGGRPYGDTGG